MMGLILAIVGAGAPSHSTDSGSLSRWLAAEARSLHRHAPSGEERTVATQYLAVTLVHVGRCDEAAALLAADDSVREGRIQAASHAAVRNQDWRCAVRLTELQLQRPDTLLSPQSRGRLRLEAGAVMLAAGRAAEGKALIREAEDALTQAPAGSAAGKTGREALWSGRFTAQWIYKGTPLFEPALEAHGRALAANPADALQPTRSGFQQEFVGAGRTDLAEAVAERSRASGFLLDPSVSHIARYATPYRASRAHCPDAGPEAPALIDRKGLRALLEGSDWLSRMSMLMNAAQAQALALRCGRAGATGR